jgi:[acyl-carrier-protein] S-malonyltransferase
MMNRSSILLFPGQGTEAVGMSMGWEAHRAWIGTVQAAERHTGYPLRRLMAEGPLEDLRFQRHAPCAVLAHSVGVFRTWREAGMPLPEAAAGHSMGFYSALVAAGVVPLEAALDLLATVEGLCEATFADRAMGMAFVIGVPELEVRQALLAHPALALSNRNGQAQFTVSGPVEHLEALVAALQPAAFKIGLLPVKHPLHGPHMTALLPAIARRMGAVAPSVPDFPLISHFDGRLLSTGMAAWDDGLASVALPVDWLAVVARLRALGAPLAECGTAASSRV